MSTSSSSSSSSSDVSSSRLNTATPPPAPMGQMGWGSWMVEQGTGLAKGAASRVSSLWQGTKSRVGKVKDVAIQGGKKGFNKVKSTALSTAGTIRSTAGIMRDVATFGRHPVDNIKKAVSQTPPEPLVALNTALDEIISHPNAVTEKNLFDLHTALTQISDQQWRSYLPNLSNEELTDIHNLRDSSAPQMVRDLIAFAGTEELELTDEDLATPKQLQQAIRSVINERTGIVDKAVQRLGEKIMDPNQGIIAQWIRTPEVNLTNIQEGVCLLQKSIQDRSPREKLLPITLTLKNLIRDYCQKLPSTSYLKLQLNQLLQRLSRYNRFARTSPSILNNPLKNALKALNDAVANETGPLIKAFEKVGTTVVEKLTRKAQETLPEVFGKPPSPFAAADEDASKPKPVAAADKAASKSKPAESAPPATSLAPSQSKAKPGILGSLLSYGLEQISSAINSGVKCIGDQGARYIGIWLLPALQEGVSALQGKPAFKDHREKLKAIIAQISEKSPTGVKTLKNDLSLQHLWQILKDNIEWVNSVNINIDGFDLPKISSSSEPPDPKRLLIQNSHEVREAKNLDIDPVTTDKSSWKQRAQIEKKLWVRNTTNFVIIKRIFERVCKFGPNNALYYQLMQEANQAANPKTKLKELFFNELSQRGIGGFQRAYLKVYYTIFWSFLNNILKDLTANISKEVFKWIETNKQNEYTNFKSMIIENFTRYLGILRGSYQRVANDPKPYDKPEKMLIKDLVDPELNDGYTTEELYTNFAQGLFKKYVKSWFNAALLKLAIGDGKELVQGLINSGIKSLSDDYGYTHTLNTLLVEQLEHLIQAVRYEIASGKKLNPKSSNPALSEHKKLQLQSLVKNLLEVLPMGKCNTHTELRTLLNGDSLKANLTRFKDSVFLDKVIETLSDGISSAMNMLLKKDRLHEFMYKITSSLNRIYSQGDSSTLEQREATQDRLSKLSSELLDLHVQASLDRYLNPPEDSTSTPTKTYIKKLKKSTLLFVSQVKKHLKRATETSSKLVTKESISIINALLEKADTYQENCLRELQEIEQSGLSTNNKNALKKRYEDAAKKAKPLIKALSDLKHGPHRLMHNKALRKKIKIVDKTLDQIKTLLGNEFLNLTNCQLWIEQLKIATEEISRLKINDPAIEAILEKTPLLRKKLKLFFQQRSLLTFCKKQRDLVAECEAAQKLNDPNPWLDTISSLSNPKLKEKFSQIVKQIAKADNPQAFKSALNEYKNALETAEEETASDLKKTKEKIYKMKKEISNVIKTKDLMNHIEIIYNQKNIISEGIKTAKKETNQLETWANKELDDVLQHRVSSTILKSAAQRVSGYIRNEIKDILDNLLQLLRREETYLIGLARHQLLLPYLRAT
ncbi:MAG: hypothetical protein K2P51_04800 [Rhabdochlamydiaceae bacterium]|nr:hypothetical protein [Rhabdochlamydiaceae bacterium]